MTPDEHTNQEFFLDVGDGHKIYVQDWGKANAKIPILFLHGGPGDGCDNKHKQLFNPTVQRVIFHDQRGAGKSTPAGSLENNTTQDLIEDIEKITRHLELGKFVITGGSWGSTLALAYGIVHPEKVTGLVIDGVYTASRDETEWFEGGGWHNFFPDVWEQYKSTVPESYQDNPSAYHFKQVFSGDAEKAKRSAYAFLAVEVALLKLDDRYTPKPYDEYEPGGMLIEIHYLANHGFMPDKHILNNAAKLTMPVYIIQGRYDMICRPKVAYELHKALSNSKLIWTINGHSKQHEAKNILALLLDQLTGEN